MTSQANDTITSASICPYTGLRSFSAEEALYFKGRDIHIESVIELLQNKRFLMLTGASGDGKSSLVYAGLIPNAKAGFFKAQYSNWIIADFRPERKPLDNLADALSVQFDVDDPSALKGSLGLGYSALVDLYKSSGKYMDPESEEWKSADGERQKQLKQQGANLLVLVDQFEEFFTNPENFVLGAPSPDAKVVVNLLIETNRIAKAENLPIYVACTMRSDYIGNCAGFNGLPELIGDSHYFVPRLNRNEVFQVIDEPALLSGNRITPRLTERLLADLKEGLDLLPVLQHALYRIWEAANADNSDTMDLIHYAKVGGIDPQDLPSNQQKIFSKWYKSLPDYKKNLLKDPALENVLNAHADELYETIDKIINEELSGENKISKSDAQYVVQVAFTSLTRIDDSREVRNRMSVQEILDMVDNPNINIDHIYKIVDVFRAQGNTLVRPYVPNPTKMNSSEWMQSNLTPDTVLDITHEALIRNWNRLLNWAREDHEGVGVFTDYQKQLNRWLESEKSREHLLSAGQLSYFETWYDKQNPTLGWIHRYKQSGNGTTQRLGAISDMKRTETLADNITEFLNKSDNYINKKKKFAATALVVISMLFVVSVFAFINAYIQKGEAEYARKVSQSNEIAMKAFLKVEQDPTLAFRLGEEAFKIHEGNLAKQAITEAYNNAPFYKPFNEKMSISFRNIELFNEAPYLVISIFNGNIELWDLDGNRLQELEGHLRPVYDIQVFPNDDYILTGSLDSTVILWGKTGESNEWELKQHWKGFNGKINNIELSKDVKYFVLNTNGEKEGTLVELVKNGESYALGDISNIDWPGYDVNDIVFSPNSDRLLVSTSQNASLITNLEGEIIQELKGHSSTVENSYYSPNGEYIITASGDNSVILWKSKSKGSGEDDWYETLRIDEHSGEIQDINFFNDSKHFVTCSQDNTLKIYNLTGSVLKTLKGHTSPVSDFTVSKDGTVLISGSSQGATLYRWNLNHINPNIIEAHVGNIYYLNYNEDAEIIVSSSADNYVKLWNLDGSLKASFPCYNKFAGSIQLMPRNKTIMIASERTMVQLVDYNGNTKIELSVAENIGNIRSGNVSKDEKYIAIGSTDGEAILWDIENNSHVSLNGHRNSVRDILVAVEANRVLTASDDQTAILWNFEGEKVKVIKGVYISLRPIDISSDEKYFAVGTRNNTAQLYNMNGEQLTELIGHEDVLTSVMFSPDTERIFTTSLDNTVRVWDLKGNSLKVLHGHTAFINEVAFSPDGKYFATPADDKTVRIWDMDGNIVNVLKGHTKGVQVATFTPDCKRIITGSQDGTIRIWPVFVEDIIKAVNEEKEFGNIWQMNDEERIAYGINN